ncbi:3-oxoacyl-[acyl-carrier protein] reductase [Halobacillus karajensis]|uniref:4-formylbenzenesulfonate dehydrogenase TsaC1/TsaC2 n=1 Tax=Halobacillus karajensis TaxID=195088 RepID=A0A024P3F8_9BACI|nr:SDR family oxidoreductase [Halobacillus karajensis]CDQ19037.1 4-formylbenzenesulfonate dehydrogenase TsaC1/TsaC2 [Halobacillus karajensis]CDQ22889.1 4-formylbenzenesulfonate dehydrogenase TsaC1/TsaC2 [Halobacillus karajensis]CDQ26371.1 4-formylbenzenesulfonate dehydrogenase TsaC1/TsaC2 [Halobacillus karajensis]SEH42590.1 3-oxoacyl-[acyl-carrier protein] reductase [Halobacillus karajensis]
MPRFEDTVAVITGAGSGIGEQTALQLAREGGKVVLVGRTVSKLEKVAERINEGLTEPAADIFRTDVTIEKEVHKLADFVQSTYGDLHVVVNNAGTSGKSTIMEMEETEWDRIQNTNLKSVYLVSQSLGRVMMKASEKEGQEGDRAIVNVASLSGHKAGAKIPHYSSSKAAVINFSKSLALEFAPYGIRVNTVSPGFAETPLTEEGLRNKRFEEAIQKNTALGRIGKPEEIAAVITFAASKEASYMTGSDLLVDGGWLIK